MIKTNKLKPVLARQTSKEVHHADSPKGSASDVYCECLRNGLLLESHHTSLGNETKANILKQVKSSSDNKLKKLT
jgi:hypothetical protein